MNPYKYKTFTGNMPFSKMEIQHQGKKKCNTKRIKQSANQETWHVKTSKPKRNIQKKLPQDFNRFDLHHILQFHDHQS